MKIIKKCQGYCVACNSGNLEYGTLKFDGTGIAQYVCCTVTCNDCNCEFKEYYELEYVESEKD